MFAPGAVMARPHTDAEERPTMKPIRLILALALVAALAATVAVAAVAKSRPTEPKLIPGSMVNPAYPEQERKDGVQGTVILAVELSAAGIVTGATVDKAVEGHPAFSDAAIAAVKQWRFEPARLDGKPVGITVEVPVKFALK